MITLTTEQIIQDITTGKVSLRLSLLLATTPKEFVIQCKGNYHATDHLERTINRILIDYPNLKANEIKVVNAKEYKDHLLTVKIKEI